MPAIWGKYNGRVEKIDDIPKSDLGYALGEYRMAFGKDWKLWTGLKRDEPSDNVELSGPSKPY